MCFLFFHLTNVQSLDGGAVVSFLGVGYEAGADEDDFHMLRRRNLEIDGDEREDAGVVKTSGGASVKQKKVVYF